MEYLAPAVLVALVTVVVLYIWWWKKIFLYWKKRGIPYENTSFGLYFLYQFNRMNIHEAIIGQYKKHGRVYGTFEFWNPVLTVCDPDLLRDILVKDFHLFNYRRDFPGDQFLTKMVSALKGEDWKRVRTLMTPAFTSRKMRQMSYIINECAKHVVETLGKSADRGETVNFKNIFGSFTLDVIASAAFATKIDSLNDPENIFVKHVKKAFATPSLLILLSVFILPHWLVNLLGVELFPSSEFFRSVILQVIKDRKDSGKRHNDMLQMMLEAQEELEKSGSPDTTEDENDQYGSVTHDGLIPQLKYRTLSEDEIIAQCVLFFIVGYETTASTLCYMAYNLVLNPECQEKLIEEVDEAFEKHEEMNYDVIRDMKYLDLVLSETLRLYPVLTRSERTACADYKLGDTGLVIEKGTVVGFNIQAMHLDPEFFPNPEKFEPERFLPENSNHPQYAYLPFGAGPRNCLGMRFAMMEIKLGMCHILRNYKFKKAPTTKVPPEFKIGQQLLCVDDLPLIVERRNVKQMEK